MKALEKIKGFFAKKDKRTPLEHRIDELTERMANYDQYSDEYKDMADNLRTLSEANSRLKEKKCSFVDGNVLFNGLIATIQILIILAYEERHVIRSRATSFITKLIGKK